MAAFAEPHECMLSHGLRYYDNADDAQRKARGLHLDGCESSSESACKCCGAVDISFHDGLNT